MSIPADQIDPDARKVIRRLKQHQYEAYLVGGCVRDLLLARKPKDFDIATSATPNEVKALFRNCRIIGRRFRLAHIFFGSKIIETATFRSNPREAEPDVTDEGEPADDLLIRRDNVFGTAEEDARRRDFTINGLFFDLESDEVIDYVGGLKDLAAKLVRSIGEAEIRFREDPVRILRAIKFAARLGFDIEDSAYQAILDHKGDIPKCAPPRVLEEIYRLLRGGAGLRSVELLRDTGVLDLLIPEVGELLRERPDSREARWIREVLARIDANRDRTPSNAVLLSVLLGAFVGEALFEEPASATSSGKVRDIGQLVDELVRPVLERMRVSRRDGERARQILMTLRRIGASRRRRGRVQLLARRDYFGEALQVYELLGPVIRPGEIAPDELARWRRLGAEAGEGAPAEGEEEPRRRRRRRRGGRRELDDRAPRPSSAGPLVDAAEADEAGEAIEAGERAAVEAREAGEPVAGNGAPSSEAPAAAASAHDQTSDAPPSTGSTTPVR